MSKLIYKLEVPSNITGQVRVSSDIERLAPAMLPMGNSQWNEDNWDENFRSRKLIRAIGDKKKFGFFVANTNQNDYWWNRYRSGDTIERLTLKIMGDGITKKNQIYDARVIPASFIPMPVGDKWFCIGYTLQFNESDIDSGWSLSN